MDTIQMIPSSYLSQTDLSRAIGRTQIFASLGVQEQNAMANKLYIVHRPANEIVIEQGDVGDSLYIIVKGYVSVSIKHKTKGWIRINRLGPGDVFGEIALIRNVRRTARITTEEPCTFLTINARDFLEIYQTLQPRYRDNIQMYVAKRLASHTRVSN